MFWIVIVIVAVIAWVVYANSPGRRLSILQESLDRYGEDRYRRVQELLQKDINKPYDDLFDEKLHSEILNSKRVQYELNVICRRHVKTVLSSDQHSIEAKQAAVTVWHECIGSLWSVINAIEVGYLDSDGIENSSMEARETYNAFVGVMAAFDFDIEAEAKAIEKDVQKRFPMHKRTVKKRRAAKKHGS